MNFMWRMISNVTPGLQFLLVTYLFCLNLDFKVENKKFTRIVWVPSFTQRLVLKVILRVQLLHIADSFCLKFEHKSTISMCCRANALHSPFDFLTACEICISHLKQVVEVKTCALIVLTV